MYSRVYVEITNICNRSCSFCPGTIRPLRRMSLAEFDTVTDRLCGVTEYITARRIEQAKHLLAATDLPVGEICERVGITNTTYFCRLFKKETGMTTSEYIRTIKSHLGSL